jgi:hypothetical protein
VANNRIYLACTNCDGEPFYLGKRMQEGYYHYKPLDLNDWFDAHRHCGGTHDHFCISYQSPRNFDMDGWEATVDEVLRRSSRGAK